MTVSHSTAWHRRPGRRALAVMMIVAVVLASTVVALVARTSRAAPIPSCPVLTGTYYCPPPGYTLPYNAADFKTDVVYQVMLDRFFDGNPANDNPPGDTGLYDPTKANWKLYWGGDLQGLTDKLPYIAGMGVTALWISPPVDNIHTAAVYNGVPNAGYHGYWARDDYRIDPHMGTWSDFDTLVRTAHKLGMKLIVDFAPNHSNPNDTGEFGSIYQNGVLQAAYNNDPNGWFHHNGGISDYNYLYQDEYYNLADLADLAQENPSVDSYLKGAIDQFLAHGVDGVRVDAVKHMPGPTGGWLRTFNDNVESQSSGPHYMVGEWYLSSINDPTYHQAVRFANDSGIALLNFPFNTALRDVYGYNSGGAYELNSVLSQEASDFTFANDQANFIDNHDMPRFLTINNSQAAMQEALAVSMDAPGVPIIYYGTEQYLHNDTNGGGDPYNRPMMSSFSTTTTAYQEIHALAALRHSNPALGYGTYLQRWVTNDVIVFERQFFNSVVLTAVNRSGAPYTFTPGLFTNLPAGTYSDVLRGLLGGQSITVGSGGAVTPFTLNPNAVGVWQFTAGEPATPEIGSVGPETVHAGDHVIIDGQGFGANPGSVTIDGVSASVLSWRSHSITVAAPTPAQPDTRASLLAQVHVTTGAGTSNPYPINLSSGPQIPVTFTVNNAQPTNFGDNIYLVGDQPELGHWTPTTGAAIGPLNPPNYPNWFIMAAMPACATIQFKFVDIQANGNVIWENGPNHTYTVPCSGEGTITVTWQY